MILMTILVKLVSEVVPFLSWTVCCQRELLLAFGDKIPSAMDVGIRGFGSSKYIQVGALLLWYLVRLMTFLLFILVS